MMDNIVENAIEGMIQKVGDGTMEGAFISSIKEITCTNPNGDSLICSIKTFDLPMVGDLDLKITLEKGD